MNSGIMDPATSSHSSLEHLEKLTKLKDIQDAYHFLCKEEVSGTIFTVVMLKVLTYLL